MLLARSSQVGMERPSGSLVPPDVAVDGLMADAQVPETAQMSRDLLEAPLAAEQFLDKR
jgi:hypothetical protein